jgi:O-antigen/teichoic acid export membrane protein
MKAFLNDLLRVGVSKGFMVTSGIVTSVITARYLGPEKNGLIASLLVYPGLFMSVGSLGVQQSTAYFIGKNLYTEEQIKRAVTQIWLFTSFFAFIICYFLIRDFSNSGDNLLYVILVLIPIPFALFNTYNSGLFLGKNQIKTFNQINWIPSFITLLFCVALIILYPLGISGYLIAQIGGPVFISIVLIFKNKFIKSFSLDFDWEIIKKMLNLGMVYALALLVINLNYRFDVIMLDKMSSQYELGIYSKGANIIQFLWQIPMLLSTIVFARSAVSKDNLAFSHKVAQLLRISFIAIGAFSVLMMIFSKLIIVGLFGIAFEGSVTVLQYLIPGVVLLTIFKVMNMDLAGKGMPSVSLKAMVPGLIINVIANRLLIPKHGANGAAIASTISYTISSLLFLHFYSNAVKIPIIEIIGFKKSDWSFIVPLLKKLKRTK